LEEDKGKRRGEGRKGRVIREEKKINKGKLTKYCTSQQMNQNLEAFKNSNLKTKAGVLCDGTKPSTPAKSMGFARWSGICCKANP